jgi:PhnB protein
MNTVPYLQFSGNCEEAFKFYEKCLGGKITAMVKHAGTPAEEHVSAGWRDKIIHARMSVGNTELMGVDMTQEHYTVPTGFTISIQVKSPEEADRVFHALSEKGKVRMPLQQTFFSPRYGSFIDRFGVPWMVVCEQPAA